MSPATGHLPPVLSHLATLCDGCTTTRSIDNHVMKLRRKLENDPRCPIHFHTVTHRRRAWRRFSCDKYPNYPNYNVHDKQLTTSLHFLDGSL
jgi:hypothetical protein